MSSIVNNIGHNGYSRGDVLNMLSDESQTTTSVSGQNNNIADKVLFDNDMNYEYEKVGYNDKADALSKSIDNTKKQIDDINKYKPEPGKQYVLEADCEEAYDQHMKEQQKTPPASNNPEPKADGENTPTASNNPEPKVDTNKTPKELKAERKKVHKELKKVNEERKKVQEELTKKKEAFASKKAELEKVLEERAKIKESLSKACNNANLNAIYENATKLQEINKKGLAIAGECKALRKDLKNLTSKSVELGEKFADLSKKSSELGKAQKAAEKAKQAVGETEKSAENSAKKKSGEAAKNGGKKLGNLAKRAGKIIKTPMGKAAAVILLGVAAVGISALFLSNAEAGNDKKVDEVKPENKEKVEDESGTDKEETEKTEEVYKEAEELYQPDVVYTVVEGDNLWNMVKEMLTKKNGKKPTNKEISEGIGRLMGENGLHYEPNSGVVIIRPDQEIEHTNL